MAFSLEQLDERLAERAKASPDESYTAKLLQDGVDRCARKFGEEAIETIVAAEVNPALAAHGGFITFMGHDGEGKAYVTMGGGCHGCSMSRLTMLEGVQTMIVDAVPGVERVLDVTDHETGENPYFS